MPRTINTGNVYGAALKAIFTPPDATLPVVEEASSLSLAAQGVAVIDSTANAIGAFSFDARGDNTNAASGFATSTTQAGLTYPCVIFCEHIIGASPSNGGDPVFGVFFGSDKVAFIRFISSANPKYEGVVRNRISGGDDRLDIIPTPVLGSFSGVNKLALVLVSDTERYLYWQSAANSVAGATYTGSNPTAVINPFPASPVFKKYGIGCSFDDAGALFVGATAGKIGNAGFFNTSFTAPQLTTFFANPGQLFNAPAATLTGTITTDEAAPTGTLSSLAPASLTGNITTDAAAPTGTLGAGVGTITTNVWKNDAGDPQPSLTVPLMTFLRRSDGLQVLTLANQVTSSSPTAPVIAVSNAALVPGVIYMVASWNADGSLYGIEPYQAA